MMCAVQYFEGKATIEQLAKSWIVSYIGNFIGASIIVAMISGAAIFPEAAAGPLKLAAAKCSLTFKQVWVDSASRARRVCINPEPQSPPSAKQACVTNPCESQPITVV